MKHVFKLHWFTRIGLLALLAVALQGCGGGGGGTPPPPPDANPTGYYTNSGTATVKQDDNTTDLNITDLQAMVHGNRIMMMSVHQDLVYDGSITVSQNNFSGTVTVYRGGEAILSSVGMSGTVITGTSITGTLMGAGAGNGAFDLLYATTNNQVADLSRIENTANATWGAIVGNGTDAFEFIIDGVGVVIDDVNEVGGLFEACQFGTLPNIIGGTISPIAGSSLYEVNVALVTCADIDVRQEYSGLATTQTSADETLVFIMTSGDYSFAGDFQ